MNKLEPLNSGHYSRLFFLILSLFISGQVNSCVYKNEILKEVTALKTELQAQHAKVAVETSQ